MNWGYKILTVIIVFIVVMLGMVYYAFQQTNEMVDANYYEKEMQYQHLINASAELNKVYDKDIVLQQSDSILIKIPAVLNTNFTDGIVVFQRNSNQKKDQTIKIIPNQKGDFYIRNQNFIAGNYVAKVSWKNNSKSYYKEQKIFIQK